MIYCQLCANFKRKKDMYSVSERCQHQFCANCLYRQLEISVSNNEDFFCPVDYCPNVLGEDGRFFQTLPNNLHNKYVIWKNSSDYLDRNQSFRVSVK